MANPIIECINASASTIYRVAVNRLTGEVGNQNTHVWEAFNPANWAQYAVALAEFTGAGYYWAARPTWEAGSLVTDVFYVQAGGSPAITDKPPFNLLHNQGENVAAINADPVAAPENLAAALGASIQGAVAAGTLTNSTFPTNVTGLANNLIVGRTLTFLTGANAKQAVQVLTYNGTTGVIGTSPMIGAPSVADTFIIQ